MENQPGPEGQDRCLDPDPEEACITSAERRMALFFVDDGMKDSKLTWRGQVKETRRVMVIAVRQAFPAMKWSHHVRLCERLSDCRRVKPAIEDNTSRFLR